MLDVTFDLRRRENIGGGFLCYESLQREQEKYLFPVQLWGDLQRNADQNALGLYVGMLFKLRDQS